MGQPVNTDKPGNEMLKTSVCM